MGFLLSSLLTPLLRPAFSLNRPLKRQSVLGRIYGWATDEMPVVKDQPATERAPSDWPWLGISLYRLCIEPRSEPSSGLAPTFGSETHRREGQ